ncbi:MAG: sugar ABC transporter ATP-binding protein [Fimbriimonadaceae bacterium]
MQSAEALASARGIRVQFGGIEVLKGVDLDLRPGEIHAITGENGAGKSTLAKVLAGIYRPSSGTVEISGTQVAFRSPSDAVAAGVALVHQEPMTFDHLSVAENIFLGARPRRLGLVDWSAMNTRAAAILAGLGQAFDPRTPVGHLNLAARQMVEVASAVAQGAKVILLDETTAALSPGEVDELFAVVKRLRDEGRAIAFVSHRLAEVFALCDRVTVLRDGAKVGEVRPGESDVPTVVRMMVGRDLDVAELDRSAPGPAVLRVYDLTVPGVHGVNLQVHAGEIVALAGLVGSGRTEIAHALFGIDHPSAGRIELGGQAMAIKDPRHALRLGVALVPEDRLRHGILAPMSLAHNVSLPILSRISRFFLHNQVESGLTQEWIAKLGVVCRGPEQPISQLSGGNQQKLVIGKWLGTEPRLLIVDEPTRGVDVGAKAEVHKLLRDLASQGLAILVISSDLPEVLTIADRVLVMREGVIARAFDAADATEEKIMLAATGQEADAA